MVGIELPSEQGHVLVEEVDGDPAQFPSQWRPRSNTMTSSSFLQESYSSSVDFPTYIPWQTLSSDLSDKLKQGSLRLTRKNRVEYAPIKEEAGERWPLLLGEDGEHAKVTPAMRTGTSWPVAAFLLINSALGAGVLNYPAAYDRTGVLLATLLQILMLVLLISTMMVLAYCADLNNDNTYHDVLMSVCGKRAQQLSAVSIMFTCFGICITFLIIIGDQYDRLFASMFGADFCHSWYLHRQFTISITAVLIILPMCYFQRLDFLRYASTLGVFAMLYPVVLTIFQFYKLGMTKGPLKTGPSRVVDVFVIIPVICFAYQTHEIVVPVYSCMRHRNLKDFAKATFLAMGFLFVIYVMVGTFGYLTFGTSVMPDIMQLYDANDPFVLIGIGALVVKMATTYAPLLLCGRGALDGLYAEFAKISVDDFIHGERRRRIWITTLWFIASVLLAVFTPNIGVVIELLGSLASANIFLFPGICLIIIVINDYVKAPTWGKHALVFLGALMLVFGAFVFGVVMVQAIWYDINNSQASKPHEACS